MALFLSQKTLAAVPPPPPDGPPSPVLSSISISGPLSIDEQSTAQYVCTAIYSDGSTAPISATWGEDSASASIDSSGLLTAGSVSANEAVTITATVGTKTVTYAATISDVIPDLSGITINGPTSVDEETTAQYTCTANWSDGSTTTVTPSWSENSSYASISASGVLSAGNVTSDKSVTITASYNGMSDTHAVTIKYVAPTLSSITINGPTLVDEETSAQYSCIANWSDGSTTTVTPSWSENSSYASISAGGILSAGNVTSDQGVTVTATYNGKSDTQAVTIKYVAPTLSSITITGPASVDEESSAQYSCIANWSDGTTTTVSPSWSENSSYASISAGGLLTADNVTSDKSVTITATYNGKSDTQAVTINYVAPTLNSIAISGPASVDEETTAQYSCTASWSDGTTTTVTPTWSENSPYTTIDASGLLSAGNVTSDKSVTITASYNGQSDTYPVAILYVAPPVTVTGISITGPSELDENSTASYSCTASYSDGSTATVTPVWSENAAFATIDTAGTLTVGNIDADAGVTVTASFDGFSDTQAVTVWMVGTQVVYPLSGFAGQTVWARLWDESAQTWYDLGEMTSPEELVIENVNPNQWYWISIKVYNELTGTWDKVQSNWLNM